MTTEPASPDVVDAWAAVTSAQETEAEAFAEVDRLRGLAALGRVPRGELQKAQNRLARLQGATGDAIAGARLLDREADAARAAAAAAAERQKANRAAVLRAAGEELGRRIADDLASIANDLAWLAAEAYDHEAGRASMSPATDARRARAWATVMTGISSLRTWYTAPREPAQRPHPPTHQETQEAQS